MKPLTTSKIDILVDSLHIDFDAGKIPFIHVPIFDNSNDWIECLINNINFSFNIEYPSIHTYSDSDSFNLFVRDLFNFEYHEIDWKIALQGDINSDLSYVILNFSSLDADWVFFLNDLIHQYLCWDKNLYSKKIIIILYGYEEYPDFVKNAAVSYFQFWNVINWEEMRTLAKGYLVDSQDPFLDAWKLSSYVGASCCNPFLLKSLCNSNLISIKEIEVFISDRTNFIEFRNSDFNNRHHGYGEAWLVPKELFDDWASGMVLGASLDRGKVTPWSSTIKSDFSNSIRQFIWKEQVISLYPITAEISDILAEEISEEYGREWEDFAHSSDYLFYKEPAAVLSAFGRRKKLGALKRKYVDLLEALKDIRNDLSHRSSVECHLIRKLSASVKFCNIL